MIKFASILSKASFENEDVRSFLKGEALKQFAKNYDVLYYLVKDKVINNKTLKETKNISYTYTVESDILAKNLPICFYDPIIIQSKESTVGPTNFRRKSYQQKTYGSGGLQFSIGIDKTYLVMKKAINFLLILILSITGYSCKKENQEDIQNKIRLEITSNTPGAPIQITGTATGATKTITIKDSFEEEYFTKKSDIGLSIYCSDPKVLINLKYYVNGKLISENNGNGNIRVSVKIK